MSTYEVVLFPHGNAEGFPALRLTPDGCRREQATPLDPRTAEIFGTPTRPVDTPVEDIVTAAQPFWFGNCWGIWLDDFTWDARTAEIVDAFTNDERWASRHLVATVDVLRPETALQRCTLVADATRALAAATTDTEALAVVAHLHAFENITDLVVSLRYPAGPDVLDRLHAAVYPAGGGTIYAPPDAPWLSKLRASVFHARSPWAMRLRQEMT